MLEIITEYYGFLLDSFLTYSAGNRIWILYPIALICILIWGENTTRKLFVGSLVVEFLTVFNPFFMKLLIENFSFENRYLRFFWMNLFFITIAYAMVVMVFKLKRSFARLIATVVCVVLIVTLGNPIFIGNKVAPYAPTTNQFFIEDEMLELYPLFHGDPDYPHPWILYDDILLIYRQYDPSVRSTLSRGMFSYSNDTSLDVFRQDDTIDENLKTILLVYHYGDFSIPQEDFHRALRQRRVRYVVTHSAPMDEYMTSPYMELVGTTSNHKVWKVLKKSEMV